MGITRGKQPGAIKVVIYGVEGIGKSSLAAKFPRPYFVDVEGGTKQLDVVRFDKPLTWTQLMDTVTRAVAEPDIGTLVVDTADWAERLCIREVCDTRKWTGIEDPGYGKGYTYVAEVYGKLLNALSDIAENGINVVLTAHAWVKKFEQPDEMGAYDRWEMKTSKQVAPMIREWADMVLFANYKTLSIATDKEGKKHKAAGGQRVMYASHHPCWDAKNRFGLPDEMPLDYTQIAHIVPDMRGDASAETAPVPPLIVQPTTALPTRKTPPTPTPSVPVDELAAEGVPPELAQLMRANDVTLPEIIYVVAQRGYFTANTPFRAYPRDFVDGVLVGAWDKVLAMINANRNDVPF